jgi:vitamin B12 transporter
VVVSAARLPQLLSDTIPATSVFTREDIANSGATDLPTLLRQAPGAQIVTNGGLGSSASLFLRGASSSESLLLIDGVRIDSASLGAAQLAMLDTSAIDRVEVANGNVSALYGSGAIGGVVQVFTADGGQHPPRFHFETSYGRYGTQRQSAGVNGALNASGDTTFSFAVSRLKTNGFSAIDAKQAPNANPDDNGFRATTVSSSVKHRFTPNWSASVRYLQSDGRNSYDNAYGLGTDQNAAINQIRMISAAVEGRFSERWQSILTVAQGNDHTTAYLNGQSDSHFDSSNQQIGWRNTFVLTPQQKLSFGYDGLRQTLDTDAYGTPQRRDNAVYLGYNGQWGRNQFQANVRRDQYNDFGAANSYFLGYGYTLTPQWRVTFSYSSAFRAPTFNDLYYPGYGNTSLRPERSHSVETGLQYATDRFGVARISLFETQYRDLIASDIVSPGVYQAANVGRARVRGVEASWRGQVGATLVQASMTVQSPIDQDTDTVLSRRARRFGNVTVSHPFGPLRVGGTWQLAGARTDGSVPLSGYNVVNVSARYQIDRCWFLDARVDNLLNKRYELASTYNTPGRGAYFTLGWQQM